VDVKRSTFEHVSKSALTDNLLTHRLGARQRCVATGK
jgi:hypothetical protein